MNDQYVIEVRRDLEGGRPCLRGTVMTVANFLKELACGHSVDTLADVTGMDRKPMIELLLQLAAVFDAPAYDALAAPQEWKNFIDAAAKCRREPT